MAGAGRLESAAPVRRSTSWFWVPLTHGFWRDEMPVMLTRIDRVQVIVADRNSTAGAYRRLLAAEVAGEDRVHVLGAQRTVLRLGSSEIELLEPDGAGPVADFCSHTKGGLFAAGLATPDIAGLRAHLQRAGVPLAEEAGQIFAAHEALGVPGLQVVISCERDQPAVGLARRLYETTLLVPDFGTAAEKVAMNFALDHTHFVPIRSAEFGYDGVLTLFRPDHLDRIEVVTPYDAAKTMGRFFAKRGPCLYMCYCEADDLTPIRERLREHAPNEWTGPHDPAAPDNLFIHPSALGGMMLGVSRTTFAWTWSGHPERVRAAGT